MFNLWFNGEQIGVDEFKVGETLVKENDVIDVANPINGVITQETFDALPEEKQNHGLYIIKTDGHPLQGLEIEEYDTTVDDCNWHVRKWSNGYVEMIGRRTYTGLMITAEWGNLYQPQSYPTPCMLPFSLTKKYSEIFSVLDKSFGFFWNQNSSNLLDRTGYISPIRPVPIENLSMTISVFVSGLWK